MVLGESEIKNGTLTIKDLQNQEGLQQTLPYGQALDLLKAMLQA